MPAAPADNTAPASPCTGICRLDEAGLCLGCRRSLAEITGWRDMSTDEQRAVLMQLPDRCTQET